VEAYVDLGYSAEQNKNYELTSVRSMRAPTPAGNASTYFSAATAYDN